jgi:hypothetical protein
MKFPSIFRTATPMRFEIKPRYYDPIKEEIEERTSRIRQELKDEGLLEREPGEVPSRQYGSAIRGGFSQYRGIKPRTKNSFFSAGMIRTLFFLVMLVGLFGYVYLGPAILTYLFYGGAVIGCGAFLFRFLKRGRKDD